MVVLIGAAVAYAVWSTRTSFVIRAEREIEASADEVWNVLVDRESYPRWNPFVVSSTGPLTEGATITNVLSDTKGSTTTFTPTVLTVSKNREFRWKGKFWITGVFDGEHFFTIDPSGPGRVRLVQEEHFRGLAVPPMRSMLRKDTLAQFRAMNDALAHEVRVRSESATIVSEEN
ncbi:SRPBCC domain-containing protein [Rhodococcus sp. H29-C3]|nr:SRPBCC domain-containing protein [Rhodococcus sp. H29-C3]